MTKTIMILAIVAAFVVGMIVSATPVFAPGIGAGDTLVEAAINALTAAVAGTSSGDALIADAITGIPSIAGPQGEQGIQGEQGPQGGGDNLSGCSTNQIMKWDGSQWVCAVDKDTTEPGTIKHVQVNDDAAGNALGWTPDGSGSYQISDPDVTRDSRIILTLSGGSLSIQTPSTITCQNVAPKLGLITLTLCLPQATSPGSVLRYTVLNPPASGPGPIIIVP